MTTSESMKRTVFTASVIIGGLIATIIAAVLVVNLKSTYLAWDRGKVSMPRLLKQTEVRTDDLPALAQAMSHGTASVRYAALIFNTPDRPSDEDALNIQMSVENGRLGFDWVLLGPRNIQDEKKFSTFARAHGFEPAPQSENGVSSLRVECRDVPKFTASVVTELYGLPPNQPVGLVYEGFDWPGR